MQGNSGSNTPAPIGAAGDSAGFTARAPRTRTILRAEMKSDPEVTASVIVRDVSAGGLGGSFVTGTTRPGEIMALQLANGTSCEGHVRWADGSRFGLKLVEDLDVGGLGTSVRHRNGTFGENVGWVVDLELQPPPPSGLRPV